MSEKTAERLLSSTLFRLCGSLFRCFRAFRGSFLLGIFNREAEKGEKYLFGLAVFFFMLIWWSSLASVMRYVYPAAVPDLLYFADPLF
ncbi:MAG: hypothetical protein LBQ30_10200 [Treponema sp.]|jgi:hypothetical protein|nr:hypothetical protein [Treponema sp.]